MLPAVNNNVGAGDPTRGRAGDEADDSRHFLRSAEAAESNRLAHLLEVGEHAFFDPIPGAAFEIDRAGRDRICADAFWSQGLAEVVGVSHKGSLERTVGIGRAEMLDAAPGDIDLTVTCTPRLLPEQSPHAQLIFGSQSVLPAAISTPADPLQPTTLAFIVPAVVVGEYVVRLRVGGIDSLPVTITGSPAKLDFDPQQKVKVA